MRFIRPYLKNCKDTSCKAKTKIGDWMLSCLFMGITAEYHPCRYTILEIIHSQPHFPLRSKSSFSASFIFSIGIIPRTIIFSNIDSLPCFPSYFLMSLHILYRKALVICFPFSYVRSSTHLAAHRTADLLHSDRAWLAFI
jgi:hypothetical protein